MAGWLAGWLEEEEEEEQQEEEEGQEEKWLAGWLAGWRPRSIQDIGLIGFIHCFPAKTSWNIGFIVFIVFCGFRKTGQRVGFPAKTSCVIGFIGFMFV